jgi:hypothetical protein
MSSQDEMNQYHERVRELREREMLLKKEREQLIYRAPWYTRSQNILAILTIIIPILVSIIFKLAEKDKKELTIESYEVEKLILSNELYKNELSIKYDSLSIINVSSSRITITNTGDRPITNMDFVDGPLKFILKNKSNSGEAKTPLLLNIIKVSDANQQNSQIEILERHPDCTFTYLPSLLNHGDRIELSVLLANEPQVEVNWVGKITDGEIQFRLSKKESNQTIQLNNFAKSLLSWFKNKVVSIPFVLASFLILAIFNVVLWLQNTDGTMSSDPPILGFTLLTGLSLLSIFVLTLFLALII